MEYIVNINSYYINIVKEYIDIAILKHKIICVTSLDAKNI